VSLIRVELTFAVIGLTVVRNRIKSAPPIARRWIGEHYSKFYLYYERKGQLVSTQRLRNAGEQTSCLLD